MTKRISVRNILDSLNTVIEVNRVFPKEDSKKISPDILKTVGIQLN